MKTYLFPLTLLLLFISESSMAQTITQMHQTEQSILKNGKYALLVMKSQHLKAAIQTGIEFKHKSKKIDFQIITCGPLVKEISESAELQDLVRNAVDHFNLKILTCGLSIKQFDVDQTALPLEAPITENGLIYLFGLQEQGYRTIAL